jgi:hypothetical protein
LTVSKVGRTEKPYVEKKKGVLVGFFVSENKGRLQYATPCLKLSA